MNRPFRLGFLAAAGLFAAAPLAACQSAHCEGAQKDDDAQVVQGGQPEALVPAYPDHYAGGDGPTTLPADAAAAPRSFAARPAVGTLAKCPVSGEVHTVGDDTATYEHEGRWFAFCCPGCVNKLKANPAKYAGPPPAAPPPPAR